MSARRFPVLLQLTRAERESAPPCPLSVPWSLLAPHEAQAQRNHQQTLERLAERGGLSPAEMVLVLEDRRWDGRKLPPLTESVAALRVHLQRWHDAMQESECCLNCERPYPDCACTGGPLVDWRQP